jgi:hypothetical protein
MTWCSRRILGTFCRVIMAVKRQKCSYIGSGVGRREAYVRRGCRDTGEDMRQEPFRWWLKRGYGSGTVRPYVDSSWWPALHLPSAAVQHNETWQLTDSSRAVGASSVILPRCRFGQGSRLSYNSRLRLVSVPLLSTRGRSGTDETGSTTVGAEDPIESNPDPIQI